MGEAHRLIRVDCEDTGRQHVGVLARVETQLGRSGIETTPRPQHIRNQGQKYIPHLFAYSQLLLAVNGHEGLYGTCGTPEKFWSKWIEEEISETEFHQLKNS